MKLYRGCRNFSWVEKFFDTAETDFTIAVASCQMLLGLELCLQRSFFVLTSFLALRSLELCSVTQGCQSLALVLALMSP